MRQPLLVQVSQPFETCSTHASSLHGLHPCHSCHFGPALACTKWDLALHTSCL